MILTFCTYTIHSSKGNNMKLKTFLDELKKEGVVVLNGTNHYKLILGDKWTTCKRHPSKELSNVAASRIRKQLGLK